jgi:F0F1-type ATP synthase membrane subunit a
VRGLLNEQTAGEGSDFIFPIAATLGLYILIANWLDFLPLTFFNGLHAANANLEQTAAMAIVVIVIVQYYSIRVLGFGGYLRRFTKPFELPWWFRFNPIWIALNVLEEVTKPITLALRLFGNIFAGAVMVFLITLLLGQLPFFTVIWLALVVLVALVAVRAPGPLAEVGGLWRALAALLVAVLLLALLIMLRNQPPLDYGGFPVAEVTWSPLVLAVWKAFDVFFVGTIQAFIFTLLTIIYFGMAREGLEHEADAAHHAPRREPMLPAMKEEPA